MNARLIEPEFDDNLQFIFLPYEHPSGRQLQQTQNLATADLYQVHSPDPDLITLRGASYMDHDDRVIRSRVGKLKQWLQAANITDQSPDDEWSVRLRRQDFQAYCGRSVLPGDAAASQTSESLTSDQREQLRHFEIARHAFRREHFHITAEDLGVSYHFPWPDCPFDARKIALRHLANLGVFFRPCRPDAIEQRFPQRSVITPQYGFEALGADLAWDTSATLVILADRDPRLMTDERVYFEPKSAFFVLDILAIAERQHVILLQIDLATVDFYRSIWMSKLDELLAEAHLWLNEKSASRRHRSADHFHPARVDSLSVDIHDPSRDPPRMPLKKPPVMKEFVFGGTYAELYERPAEEDQWKLLQAKQHRTLP